MEKEERPNMKSVKLKVEFVLGLSCFFSIISQLPDFWGNPVISLLYNLNWMLLLFVFLLKESFVIKLPFKMILLPIIFDLLLIIFQLFTGKMYIRSNLFQPLHLSVFISIIGFYVGKYCDKSIIIRIIKVYIFATLILGLSVFKSTFSGINWQDAAGYLYSAKNSAATILLIAIVMMLVYFKDLKKVISVPLIFFFTSLILMMKSRATILCFAVILIYLILFYVKSPVKKTILLSLTCSFFLFILFNDQAYDLFINKIIFNNRSKTDLSVITSGRDVHFEFFFNNFKNVILCGTGGTYIEAFPLAALMSYGIVAGSILILYTFLPLFYIFNKRKVITNRKLMYLVLALNIVLVINGLFEEITPLGPGVKCFALWLLFGCCVGSLYKKGELKDDM